MLQDKYKFKVDFNAKQFNVIHLNWNYDTCELIFRMKGYVKQTLIELAQTHAIKTTSYWDIKK